MGYYGGFLIIISHGLCSSGIFYLLNINYEHLNSRSLYINKGLINYFPSLTLIWFLICSSNLSFPFSLNIFREIFLFNSLLIWNNIILILLILFSFFSVSYSLYLYSYRQHGKINRINLYFNRIKIVEYIIILIHWFPLNLIFLLINIYL